MTEVPGFDYGAILQASPVVLGMTEASPEMVFSRLFDALVSTGRLSSDLCEKARAAVNARERYQAAKKAKQSSQTSFNLERIKYEAGRTTLYDFNQATQRLKKASEDELQAKYEWAIRQKIIEFYSE